MVCDDCRYNAYDENEDEYFCTLDLDEDEYGYMQTHFQGKCRYYFPAGDEYDIVKKQN